MRKTLTQGDLKRKDGIACRRPQRFLCSNAIAIDIALPLGTDLLGLCLSLLHHPMCPCLGFINDLLRPFAARSHPFFLEPLDERLDASRG